MRENIIQVVRMLQGEADFADITGQEYAAYKLEDVEHMIELLLEATQ